MKSLIGGSVVAALVLLAGGAPAQSGSDGLSKVARVPFGVGERAEYAVTLGIFGEVGEGAMEVVKVEDIHGHPSYHLRFDLEGGIPFASVDDTLESWMDVAELFTRRFHKDQDEVNYEVDRWYDMYPDRLVYERHDGELDTLATKQPLDEVSFLYWLRTQPLEVGETYTYQNYYKRSGNPVKLKVLRRETLRGLGDAEIPVIVVQPIIRTSGLFGEGGKAEVYFTDDWRRILVKMTSKVPVIGRLGLRLTSYTPGERLSAR